jgi:2-keto-4-pentenoate hydratase/2-oxohepta-3-ene-1,7-dioic acid hydratase in catechol pathway
MFRAMRHPTWQRDAAYAGIVPQWCFSKCFDKFAPLGPLIVSPSIVGDASNLELQTLVNGELRQDSNTNDLLLGVCDIISFLSQGTTLEKGTVILTGTPAGVAMGMKPLPVTWRTAMLLRSKSNIWAVSKIAWYSNSPNLDCAGNFPFLESCNT